MAKNPASKSPARKPKHHAKTDRFVYETDEARLEMPYIENLPATVIDATEDAQTEREAQKIIFGILFDDQRDQYERLTVGELMDLFQRWNEESAITMGEL